MVARPRQDLDVYRRTFPSWVADSTDRGLLNWCHDRTWAHATRIFDGVAGVSFIDSPPTREFYVGTRYRLRVKKHDIEGRVSTCLTQGALGFLEQEPATFDGLEEVRLIAGYRWDPKGDRCDGALAACRPKRAGVDARAARARRGCRRGHEQSRHARQCGHGNCQPG